MRDKTNNLGDGRSESSKTNTKLVGGILLALALTGGAATMASAQADTPTPEVTAVPASPEAVEADGQVDLLDGDLEDGDLEGCDFGFEELSDEERAELIADITSENDRIKAALDAAGIAYTVETDEDLGVEFVVWDYEDDAANAVIDELFMQEWAQEWAEIPQAERDEIIAQIAAENDALKAALDAAGIAYTEVQDEVMGVPVVEWDFEDEAAWEVVDGVYDELYEDGDFEDGDFEDGDGEDAELDLDPEAEES